MKYLSVDVETTGLNPSEDKILELAAVVADSEDSSTPIIELPFYRACIWRPRLTGDVMALILNAALIGDIQYGHNNGKSNVFDEEEELTRHFRGWVCEHFDPDEDDRTVVHVVAAGKNFSAFDKRFIENLCGWDEMSGLPSVRFRHRALDPVMLWFDPHGDVLPPSLGECLKRAGLGTSGEASHTALQDARDVIACLRKGWEVGRF